MLNSDKLIEYANERTNKHGAYAFAFGMVWATLSEKDQRALLTYATEQLRNIQAEKEEK
jgi:urease accessory protein UreF